MLLLASDFILGLVCGIVIILTSFRAIVNVKVYMVVSILSATIIGK